MIDENETRWCDRAFLNGPDYHSDSSIHYSVTVDEKYGGLEGCIHVRDCDKKIHLELDGENEDDFENTEDKIDTMIKILKEAKKDFRRAYKHNQKVKVRIAEKKKLDDSLESAQKPCESSQKVLDTGSG